MRRKIIYSISLVLIILISIYLGYFLTTKYQFLSLTVEPGERTALVRDWYVFFEGQVKEISPTYLILTSQNESLKIEISPYTRFSARRSGPEIEAQGGTNFKTIEFQDLKIGDLLVIKADLGEKNEITTLEINRINLPQE